MTSPERQIADNLHKVRERIASACARTGRDESSVRLVAVTKYAEIDWVKALAELGVTEFGESRPQQLVERVPKLKPSINWHLIGHLQRNKARRILPLTTLIHSVDSFRLLAALDRIAGELDITPHALLEVNVSGESQKHGFEPEELAQQWQHSAAPQHVEIDGLMAMAPHVSNPEQARPAFQRLRALRDSIQDRTPSAALTELSMGMSGDFEVAIEEGATIVRVGSSLYEGLTE